MIIGICGKSGSGKSTYAQKICHLIPNTLWLDIDKIGHKVLTFPDVEKDIEETFGVKNANRKELGKIVFNDSKEMDKLTAITWKYMEIEIDNFIANHKNYNILLDWLLLPKTKFYDMCDYKFLVDTPYEVRLERAMTRDNITKEAFDTREKASIDYNKDDFDFIIKGA